MRPPRVGLVAVALVLAGCGADDDVSIGTTSTTTTSTTAAADEVTVESGVEYGQGEVAGGGSVPLLMDLYVPPGPSDPPRPVVIAIHGGGFARQSRLDPGIVDIARALAERGVVAAAIDYRLDGQDPVPSDRLKGLLGGLTGIAIAPAMAAAADDTLTAVDYLSENAGELGIDRVGWGLIGSSARAMTADTVAYALDDLGDEGVPIAFVGSLWGGILAQGPDSTGGATQLDAGEPALFLVHGDADADVPVTLGDQSRRGPSSRGCRSSTTASPATATGTCRPASTTCPWTGTRRRSTDWSWRPWRRWPRRRGGPGRRRRCRRPGEDDVLQRGLVGDVAVGGGDPADRGVEVGEAVLGDPGRDLPAQPAGEHVLVDDEQPAGAAHRRRPPAPGPTGRSCAGR